MNRPYVFDEFFSSGLEESISPFLTPSSRKWGKNLTLKSAYSALLFLILSFAFSFYNIYLSYIFLSLVYFLAGIPALIAALNDLKNLEINIDVLMTLAAFVAVLINSGQEGALLLVLFELSHGLEHSVSKKAKSALHNLNHLAPKFGHIVAEDGVIFEKSVREIAVGEKILVKVGEIVPLDGTVIEGSSFVNLVHITGESIPVSRSKGDSLVAGARNLEAALTIEVNRTSSDSTLAKIIQLITEAHEAKPKLQRTLDRFGKHYATSIIALTFLFALSFPFLLNITFDTAVYRALAFLIAASPCALIIATPTAYLSAISSCARKGILLKGGITLDALASCTKIAFDKTGTLTTGELQCVAIEGEGPVDFALSIAYGLERNVVHPIANAICKMAQEKKILPAEISAFKAIHGQGLEGIFEGKKVAIGVPHFVGAKISEENKGILAALSVDSQIFLFRFTDQIRKETFAALQALPLKKVILTGDNLHNAQFVAESVNISEVYANLKPEDKLDKVAELSQESGLAMVGDGINDAPALMRATVGISLGRIGSATAVDASDVVLLNDDLSLLQWLFRKAKKTQSIVKQNLTLALAVICLATTPALIGLIPLWVAVILHEGGTVLVGLNSLRLLRRS